MSRRHILFRVVEEDGYLLLEWRRSSTDNWLCSTEPVKVAGLLPSATEIAECTAPAATMVQVIYDMTGETERRQLAAGPLTVEEFDPSKPKPLDYVTRGDS